MNSSTFRMPARRRTAVAVVAALTAGPLLLTAPARATGVTGGEGGRASAVVLRTGLDVSLLNKTVDIPLRATLNDVRAPASAAKTALSVELDGVDRGRAVNVLRADVATSRATVGHRKAEGYTHLARAKVHVPGLPLLSLVELQQVTSKAVCETGKRPVAESNVLGRVTVLGKRVTLSAGGPTRVVVPGVGKVTLDLSKTRTTSRTAAATALSLRVSVNPLSLNVAEVEGELTLAEATCEAPRKGAASAPSPSAPAKPDVKPQTVEEAAAPAKAAEAAPEAANLAETGGSSVTPYVAGGAVLLLVLGGGALALARRRRA